MMEDPKRFHVFDTDSCTLWDSGAEPVTLEEATELAKANGSENDQLILERVGRYGPVCGAKPITDEATQ